MVKPLPREVLKRWREQQKKVVISEGWAAQQVLRVQGRYYFAYNVVANAKVPE